MGGAQVGEPHPCLQGGGFGFTQRAEAAALCKPRPASQAALSEVTDKAFPVLLSLAKGKAQHGEFLSFSTLSGPASLGPGDRESVPSRAAGPVIH